MPPPTPLPAPTTGLLLTGGGARAAYQVGVLEAIADIRRAAGQQQAGNPFPVITGTSAGAINAAALACGADDFDGVVRRIADVWRHFHTAQVYRADSLAMLDAAARWRMVLGVGQLIAKWLHIRPRSLLDNTPLAALLAQLVPLERLPQLMQQGHLQALAVTASSYSSGEHVTFFDAAVPMEPWVRSQRLAVRGPITHGHLMASSAIPFVFPATGLPMGATPSILATARCASRPRLRQPSTWAHNVFWWWARAGCTSHVNSPRPTHIPVTRPSPRSRAMRCQASSSMHSRWTLSGWNGSTTRCR